MTERLFDIDAYISEFDACVISCEKVEGGCSVVLDKTAFFPEGGGQGSDKGKIGSVCVVDVQERGGVIYHFCNGEVAIGEAHCEIDFDDRFRKMQNHTGEHILSGIACRRYGCTNVGFHLSDEYVRVDFDKELGGDILAQIEFEANRAVWQNRKVIPFFPEESEIDALDYRSKGEIEGKVRLVEIEEVDLCACCAPHVKRTGEVGVIKIVDSLRYKGGTRLFMVCGSDAFNMFKGEHQALTEMAQSMSLKREEVSSAFAKMKDEIHSLKRELSNVALSAMKAQLEKASWTEGNASYFFEGVDMNTLRAFANDAVTKCGGICAVFSKVDGEYKYIMASKNVDLKAKAAEINKALCGRGGGSPVMIQGSCTVEREEIEKFFE